MTETVSAIFRSYAEVLLVRSRVLGALLFLLLLVRPGMMLAGLVALLAAYGFARAIGMTQVFIDSGYYTYNPLLVGLAIGSIYQISAVCLVFAAIAGLMTCIVTILMAHLFHHHLRLPILSLPFVIVSSIACLAASHYSNLFFAAPHVAGYFDGNFGLPYYIVGFFKAFGALIFVPTVLVGIVLTVLILSVSRILVMLAVVGYFVGTLCRAQFLGSYPQAFSDVNGFNFILIAMAVGGIFLVPNLKSYGLALLAVLASTFLLDGVSAFWSWNDIPPYTLPFNIVSLSVLYVLTVCAYPLIARQLGQTPEDTLDLYLANQMRYQGDLRTLRLPFSGAWTVWQAFDGQWTHRGAWRHAYDFVITDPEHITHRDQGLLLDDYYCYRKPVRSPIRGRVVLATDHLPDNPIGHVDRANNWGNHVIIEDPRGFHVLLCHFQQASLKVKPGDWVERQTILGNCGNSGYSPQPHLHVQCQLAPELGDATVPFSFAGYLHGDTWHANDRPPEGALIQNLPLDKRLDALTTHVLDDILEFKVELNGQPQPVLHLVVRMDLDGSFYFDSGAARLYFGKHEGTFYHYRLEGRDDRLRALFLAMPRLPLAERSPLVWTDYLPVGLVSRGPRAMLARFLGAFSPRIARVPVQQRRSSRTTVTGCIDAPQLGLHLETRVDFNTDTGMATLSAGPWTLTQQDDPEEMPSDFTHTELTQSDLWAGADLAPIPPDPGDNAPAKPARSPKAAKSK